MEVIASPNGERRAKGDSLAPPNCHNSCLQNQEFRFGHADRCRKCCRISPLPGSSMEGRTFPDSVVTEVFGEPVCALGLYEKEEVDKRVDRIVDVLIRVERLGTSAALPPHGSRCCQPSTSRRPRYVSAMSSSSHSSTPSSKVMAQTCSSSFSSRKSHMK